MGKKMAESEFKMVDPYNENEVEGIIYRTNDRYGSLLIKKINGRDAVQYIECTPKFYYPGNVSSPDKYVKGKFPPFTKVNVYDKIDGTNIYMFRYKDADGKVFTSYKTRLVPFLKENGFKNWIKMWNAILEKYKEEIKPLLKDTSRGYAFELYGSINEILIKYDVSLDARLIYVLGDHGQIVDPEYCSDFPKASMVLSFFPSDDPDEVYSKAIEHVEALFNDDRKAEGRMFYVHSEEGETFAWKCKPKCVVEAQSQGGTKTSVSYKNAYTTAMNAMESVTGIDLSDGEGSVKLLMDETVDLLFEEYEELVIEKSMKWIERAVRDAVSKVTFKRKVLDVFTSLGIQWNGLTRNSPKEEKSAVMRRMMSNFDAKDASKVFDALVEHFSVFGADRVP